MGIKRSLECLRKQQKSLLLALLAEHKSLSTMAFQTPIANCRGPSRHPATQHPSGGSQSQVSREVAVEAPAPVETQEFLVPKLRGQQVLHTIEPGAAPMGGAMGAGNPRVPGTPGTTDATEKLSGIQQRHIFT